MPAKSAQKSKSTRIAPRKRVKRRSTSKSNSLRSKVIYAVSLLSVIGASLAFLSTLYLYRHISSKFVSASSAESFFTPSKDIRTLLVVSVEVLDSDTEVDIQDIVLFAYNTKDFSISQINVDEEILIDMPGKFAEESLSKSLILGASLSNSQDKSLNMETVVQVAKKLFGYNIDNFLLTGTSDYQLILKGLTVSDPVSMANFLLRGDIVTNLTLKDFYDLYLVSAESSALDFKQYSISSANYNQETIDKYIYDISFNSNAAVETKTVSVLNATYVSGVAAFGGRVVRNLGGHVVAENNSTVKVEESVLIADSYDSDTLHRIARYFNIRKIYLKTDKHGFFNNEIDRSDITLILGFDTGEVL